MEPTMDSTRDAVGSEVFSVEVVMILCWSLSLTFQRKGEWKPSGFRW